MTSRQQDATTETVESTLETSESAYTPVTVAIADAIAEFKDVDVTDIEPLFYSVDTDALESLFGNPHQAAENHCQFSFTHEELRMTIDADPDLRVTITER